MNKLFTGLVAGAAGLVLIVGGAGSLALWNDAAQVDAGSVDSGVMTIAAQDGAWSPDIALWVPGDSATYTANVTIDLAGDNLSTELAVDADSIVGVGGDDLLNALDIQLGVGAITGGGTATSTGTPNVYTVVSDTPAAATTLTIPVTVTVDFPADSVTDTVAQNQSVDLSGLSFTLTQLAP
jgi:alternate signal-mediated exported protein